MSENVFRNEKGLKIHKGKAHKTVSPVEKVRMSSLEVSPIKESGRIISCHNCGGDMSPSHLCQEEPEPVETFKCDLCKEVFNCDDVLDSHKAAVCQVCHVDCLDLNGRWKHEFEVHPDSDQCLAYQAYVDIYVSP